MSLVRSSRATLEVQALFGNKKSGTKKLKAGPKVVAKPKKSKKATAAPPPPKGPLANLPTFSLPEQLEDGKDDLPLPLVAAIPLVTAIFYYVTIISKV